MSRARTKFTTAPAGPRISALGGLARLSIQNRACDLASAGALIGPASPYHGRMSRSTVPTRPGLAAPWLVAAGIVGLVLLAAARGQRHPPTAGDPQLRKFALKASKDPETAAWVESTRRAVADGTVVPGWTAKDVREQLAGLR